jgi:hypothetical protein
MIIRILRQYRWGALMVGLLGPGFLWLVPALALADSGKLKERWDRFYMKTL